MLVMHHCCSCGQKPSTAMLGTLQQGLNVKATDLFEHGAGGGSATRHRGAQRSQRSIATAEQLNFLVPAGLAQGGYLPCGRPPQLCGVPATVIGPLKWARRSMGNTCSGKLRPSLSSAR